jgi:hypothetical protein
MSKTKPNQSPAITHRPWYRLHFSTWLVAALGLIVAVLLVLPGEEGYWPWVGSMRQQRAVVHGWPWFYLWRTPRPWWDDPTAPATFAWDVGDSVARFYFWPLLADVAVCALGLAAIVAFWDWRRRRLRRLQFSLRSLLLFVTIVAVALGWWGVQRAADQELRVHLAAAYNADPFRSGRAIPTVPLWVRIAIGDEQLLSLGLNKLEPGFGIDWSRQKQGEVKYFVERFPNQVFVHLTSPRDDELSDFFDITATEHLSLSHVSVSFFERLRTLAHLNWVFASRISPDALDRLGRIATLNDVSLTDSSGIDGATWSRFAENTNVETLFLSRMHLTDLSFKHIAAINRLRELGILDSPITVKGWASLVGNRRIKELWLEETLITDEGLRTLESMTDLEYVDLRGTAVTDAGTKALQAARPELEIKYDSEAPDLKDLGAKIDGVRNGKTTYFAAAGWKIQDRHLDDLGKLDRIESLALNAHHLTDVTLARVESLNELKQLDVSSSLITGRGLQHLAKLPKLRTLTLDDRQIDDEGINALKQLPALKELWIKCDLGDEGLKRLEARMNAAFANDPTVKRHFDRHSDSHSPWD